MDLYGVPEKCLLLYGDVLRKTSPDFFGAGGKDCWNKTAKSVTHPETKAAHMITTYYLVYNKKESVLMLEKTVSIRRYPSGDTR